MDNKEFDHIIKDQLASIDSSTLDASWQMMRTRLDNFENESFIEEQLDQTIVDTLDSYRIPLNKSHQEEFLRKYQGYLRDKKIKRYNIISRASILLLLLFSCFHLYDHVSLYHENPTVFVDAYTVNDELYIDKFQSPFTELFSTEENIDLSTKKKNVKFANSSFSNNNFSSDELHHELITIHSLQNSRNDNLITTNSQIQNNDNIVALIPNLNPSLIQGLLINRDDILINESLQIDIPKSTSIENQTRIGAWVSFDKNFVSTPELHVTDGLSAGVNFSKKIANLEIETGVEYAQIGFTPSENDQYFGTSDDTKSIEIGQVNAIVGSIPINVKYHIPTSKKVNFYATAEAKLNTILYNKNEERISNHERGTVNFRSDYTFDVENPSKPGVFEGGNVKNNTFLTASIGFGVEQEMAKNLVVFLEPSLQTQVFSKPFALSTNDLNSLNIKLGIRKRI